MLVSAADEAASLTSQLSVSLPKGWLARQAWTYPSCQIHSYFKSEPKSEPLACSDVVWSGVKSEPKSEP